MRESGRGGARPNIRSCVSKDGLKKKKKSSDSSQRKQSGHGSVQAIWNELARESGQPCVSHIEFGKEERYYLLLVRLSISKCDWLMKAVRPQWPPRFAATAGLAAYRHRVLREFVSGHWRHKSSIQHCRVRLGPFPLSASLTGWRHNRSSILMLTMMTV